MQRQTVLTASDLVLPLFVVFLAAHLTQSRTALVIAHLTISLPFLSWMLVSFFEGDVARLEEAARVDGATDGFGEQLLTLGALREREGAREERGDLADYADGPRGERGASARGAARKGRVVGRHQRTPPIDSTPKTHSVPPLSRPM